MSLTKAYASPDLRFEVDGANAAHDFLRGYGVPERDIEDFWTAIALHTTPGVAEYMSPTIARPGRTEAPNQNKETKDASPLSPFH